MHDLIRVEVTNEPMIPGRQYTDKSTGMPRMISGQQKVFFHMGSAYPRQFMIDVDDKVGPYRPGFYLLAGEMFTSGEYDRPKLNTRAMRLVSVADAVELLTDGGNVQPIKPAASKAA